MNISNYLSPYEQNKHFLNETIFGGAQQFGGAKTAEQISSIDASIKAGNSSQVITGPEAGTKVYFDSQDGSSSVHLSDEMLSKMSEHFNENDFHKRDDDSIILSGDAEKFVSGWYNEVAYAMGFLSVDPNGSEQYSHTQIEGLKVLADVDYISQSVERYRDFRNNAIGLKVRPSDVSDFANIDKNMNNLMLQDSDFDGRVSLKENLKYGLRSAGSDDSDEMVDMFVEFVKNTQLKGLSFASDQLNDKQIQDAAKSAIFSEGGLGGVNILDEQKKKELEIAEALAALPQIRAKIEQNGADSLAQDDKDKLKLLQLNAQSFAKKALHAEALQDSKISDIAQLSAQLSGEILGSFKMDKLV